MDRHASHIEDEKPERQAIGALALFGLVSEIINPTNPSASAEAERILFSPSVEFNRISELLEIDIATLKTNIRAYLSKRGISIPL